jgi:hypothetical protein
MLMEPGVVPIKDPSKVGSASSDKPNAEVA